MHISSAATRTFASDTNFVSLFDKMTVGNQRKYYMLGGKGGVGKTSCAASLAVKFSNHGHPTIVVSTDPAHSLSDSFDQVSTWIMRLSITNLEKMRLIYCKIHAYLGFDWWDTSSNSRIGFSIIWTRGTTNS